MQADEKKSWENSKVSFWLLILLFPIFFAGIFLFFQIKEAKAAWLASWGYRRAITISTGSALANFQVSFTLDTQALISAGKMRADCGDIRVADSDETTPLNYWIDSSCGSASTRIWAKVPSIPAGGKTIFVYYGNPSAGSVKNGNNVFEFFDDFEDGTLDATKWDSYSVTESSGYASGSPSDGSGIPIGILSKQTFPQNSILEYDVEFTGDVGGQGTGYHGFFESWISGQTAAFTEGCANPAWTMCVTQSNGGSTTVNAGADLNAHWSYEKITWNTAGTNYFAERSDGWTYTNIINTNNPTANQKILFAANDWWPGYAGIGLYVYWAGVRKYASPEPTISVGAEIAGTLSISASPSSITSGVPTAVQFTVTNSGTPISGASVDLTGGFIGSCATNVSGQCSIIITASSAVTATASEIGYTSGLTTIIVSSEKLLKNGII